MANFVQSSMLNMAGFTKKDAPKKRKVGSFGELSSGPSNTSTQAGTCEVKLSPEEIEANRREKAKKDWNPAWASIYNWAFFDDKGMSYENVVGGKLKLKGKALNVQSGGAKKKRKKDKSLLKQLPLVTDEDAYTAAGDDDGAEIALQEPEASEHEGNENEHAPLTEDHRTPAEKRYHEQKLKVDAQRLAKTSSKSHRERIEDFNQYLANLSEHYDIPKVGPG